MNTTVSNDRSRPQKIARPLFGYHGLQDVFLQNLAELIASGIPLLDVLDALSNERSLRSFRPVATVIYESISRGEPLWRSLEMVGVFSPHAITLIRIGEETGKLSQNLQVLVIQQEKQKIFLSRIVSALLYPIFILSVTVVVGITIAWFILPRLVNVFAQLRTDIPLVTRVLIRIGAIMQAHGDIIILGFFAILILAYLFLFEFSRTKKFGYWLLLHIPGVGRLLTEIEIARFGFVFGSLLDVGTSPIYAIDSVRATTMFPQYKRIYSKLNSAIENGITLSGAFDANPWMNRYIPISVQRTIAVGERSGTLVASMQKIGDTYTAKSEITIKNLTVLLEPILLVIVAAGVLFVALAVVLPIYQLVGNLNRGI